MSEEIQTIQALIESNDILQDEVTRLRQSNKILRTVHSRLRATLNSLRAQVELARFNDETFKAFCEGEFDAPVTDDVEGGLPTASSVVDPLV
jgi:hypothetical protein